MDWRSIESKWQRRWMEARIFEADPEPGRPKFFLTVAYPYPNSPQHIGHGRTYTLTDVHARYMRMKGYNVLFPMAFHYTGTPILAMTRRLREGDRELIDTFLNVYGIPEGDLDKLKEPLGMARYFHEEIKQGMLEMGYSIDWRREFTTIDPHYQKFIEWQFRKLRQGGYIKRGSHPVGWCPKCQSPVGQHDTKGDVEPEIGEYTLIKFRFGDAYMPAATLRPETVYGVTNMWVNPDAVYVEALVDGEKWIVSAEAAEKLKFLERKVEAVRELRGSELVGGEVENPINGATVPILPAGFVDPKNATGVVMSVPGHAPYDYVALEELKRSREELLKHGLDPERVESIRPVSIISVPGFSDLPARDVVERLGVSGQTDPKLEQATKEVYRAEFHRGVMKPNTGPCAGLSVQEAREVVKEELSKRGLVDSMYELLNRPVYCRCGSECVVKIFRDQWFLDYGDEGWKELARRALDRMQIVPEELRAEFEYTIGWLRERACARKAGLGTRLPWDPDWVIESLSDSVIYMAYYTIVRWLRKIPPDKVTDEVFDYVFLGRGDPEEISRRLDIPLELLEAMRREFTYFYPLDSRHSGRDLVPNHLTFMVFVHAAIFPEELWPRQIVVNGSVLMGGQKMSKSLGNIIPLRDAVRRFGADPLRLSLLISAEPIKDADFSPKLAQTCRERLERLYGLAREVVENYSEGGYELGHIDLWMLSRLHRRIKETTEALDRFEVRKAAHTALYLLSQDVQWYLKRCRRRMETEEGRKAVYAVLMRVLDAQVRLLAPFVPHVCEEIWEMMGRKPFVSTAPWPEYDEDTVRPDVEEAEETVMELVEDVRNISKATGIKPKLVCVYTASEWKWRLYTEALKQRLEGRVEFPKLMREAMKSEELRKKAKHVQRYLKTIVEEVSKLPEDKLRSRLKAGVLDEEAILTDAKPYLEEELNAEVRIYGEEDPDKYDPANRAEKARPYRPAIYVE